jgi:hypothetical protein
VAVLVCRIVDMLVSALDSFFFQFFFLFAIIRGSMRRATTERSQGSVHVVPGPPLAFRNSGAWFTARVLSTTRSTLDDFEHSIVSFHMLPGAFTYAMLVMHRQLLFLFTIYARFVLIPFWVSILICISLLLIKFMASHPPRLGNSALLLGSFSPAL